jgi:hypothetical protein
MSPSSTSTAACSVIERSPPTPPATDSCSAGCAATGSYAPVGVEGTSSYGAGLAQVLADQQVRVFEVSRPDRRARRQRGTSDPIDAPGCRPRGPGRHRDRHPQAP